jgi:glycosyltransferase involved in cell wall biosynthesis
MKMQHHQTRFSVIIPVYNRSKMATEAIESVLSQGFSDYELIVVDDGSTDETPKVLERYRDRAQIITQRNSGPGPARNRAAKAAKGEYLIFLDSDDLLMPWALGVYDAIISTIGQPAVIAAEFVYFDQCKPVLPTTPDSDVEVVVYRDFLSKDRRVPRYMSCQVVRENIFRQLGGFIFECSFEDVDFFLRARSCGPAVLVIKPPTMAYRVHEGNISNDTKWNAEGIFSLIRCEKKGIYPGERSRVLDRYAANGGLVFSYTKRFFSQGYPILGLRLFVAGFPMVFAAAFRKLLSRLRPKTPSVKIKL